MKNFTNLYSKAATLRFELKPVGNTQENIIKNGILDTDKDMAESYEKVKDIIDGYHKYFINEVLSVSSIKVKSDGKDDSLEEYYKFYTQKDKTDKDNKNFQKLHDNLRKEVNNFFKNNPTFKNLFKAELIKLTIKKEFVESDEEYKLLDKFKNFTTYFTGFNDVRKNLYTQEKIASSIPYRLIHQNLPTFIDNTKSWDSITNQSDKTVINKVIERIKNSNLSLNYNELFTLSGFNRCLVQSDIENYNLIIGFLNLEVNLYNQKCKDKKNRLPKFKTLYKQVLSDSETLAYLPNVIESDNELVKAIKEYTERFDAEVLKDSETKPSLSNILKNLNNYNLEGIYLSFDNLKITSQALFNDWSYINNKVEEKYKIEVENIIGVNSGNKKDNYQAKFDKALDKLKKDNISISYLNSLLSDEDKNIQDYFKTLGEKDGEIRQELDIFTELDCKRSELFSFFNTYNDGEVRILGKDDAVEKVKSLLDSYQRILHFIKPLTIGKSEVNKDEIFYSDILSYIDILDQGNLLYNSVRNYLTKKPYSTEKIKLNFNNYNLLGGWDKNKERDYCSIIFRKSGLYYLGIMDKKSNKVFEKDFEDVKSAVNYEKMDYKFIPNPYQSFPKIIIKAKKNRNKFKPSEELLKNYELGKHKKGDQFDLKFLRELIDFYKSCIPKYDSWKCFDFNLSPTEKYKDISEFYKEVSDQGYKIEFNDVPEEYINELVDEGKLYLFQIYNKDFSEFSKGRPNLHTMYWKMLFSEENLKDVVYKLSGEAEIFFRKASIDDSEGKSIITHKAKHPIENKNKLNDKKSSSFDYDIIKDRRYTVDKYQFHVPISMNYKAEGKVKINELVYKTIREKGFDHIIGIDRGERHLLYLSLINLKGEIVKQMTLNDIINEYRGNKIKTDYHQLLDEREKSREEARRSWKSINDIKDLKKGYLSQVVHIISKMIVEYNAIVVLEDLNSGFKNSRKKVEKQVYQEFEKMLITKLNFLVDKTKSPSEEGGLLKAYQLTEPFTTFQKLGKQTGVIFYVPAWNTSKIDPVTGFCNMFDTRYKRIDDLKSFFSKFKKISYNTKKGYFEFSFSYKDFTPRAEGSREDWVLCTVGKRIRTFRDKSKNSQWVSKEFNLTEAYKDLFEANEIEIEGNIKSQICSKSDKSFFEELLSLLKFTLQMRNSEINSTLDYMQSPVCNKEGKFYNSEEMQNLAKAGSKEAIYPIDADANGAYNIARKGLWCYNKISSFSEDKKIRYKDLAISNKEWLKFVQDFDK